MKKTVLFLIPALTFGAMLFSIYFAAYHEQYDLSIHLVWAFSILNLASLACYCLLTYWDEQAKGNDNTISELTKRYQKIATGNEKSLTQKIEDLTKKVNDLQAQITPVSVVNEESAPNPKIPE